MKKRGNFLNPKGSAAIRGANGALLYLQACQRGGEFCNRGMPAADFPSLRRGGDQGFIPGAHSGRNPESASQRTGDSIDLMASVMCAKSIVLTSSDGRW